MAHKLYHRFDENLSEVEAAIFEAFKKFEDEGFTEMDLARIKAKLETGFYNQIASIFFKAYQLASYNEYANSPGFISEDLQNSLDVTSEDVLRVYNTYIKDKPFVLTSFVPKGKTELIAENSEKFPIVEEAIVKMKKEEKKVITQTWVPATEKEMKGLVARMQDAKRVAELVKELYAIFKRNKQIK